MQSRTIVIGAFLLVLCVSASIAQEPPLSFLFRDVQATTTAQETDTYGINNSRAIAGDYVDSNGIQHGMILGGTNAFVSADRPDCVTTPGSTSIAFYGINNVGAAAGWCTSTSGPEIGFTWAKGKFTDIKISGATLVNANGINDSGAVVGTYDDANGVQHGFLLEGGTLTKLDPPGTVSLNTAWGINNAGVITVFGTDSNGTYLSFTTADKGQTYTPFHAPGEGSTGTAIHQINNNGDIVATVFDSSGNRHGVLFHGGQYYTYDDPNGVGSTRADGLNDMLVMVGRYGSGVYGGTGFEAFTQP
jgi:probable HAF family extracellular repeat protein